MESGILLTWIGALLIICGVIYGATEALWRGRLSDARRSGAPRTGATLEPRQSPQSFSFKAHWPALGLIILGSILILTETAL